MLARFELLVYRAKRNTKSTQGALVHLSRKEIKLFAMKMKKNDNLRLLQ